MATITTSPYTYATATTFTASMANSNFAHIVTACVDGTVGLCVNGVEAATTIANGNSTFGSNVNFVGAANHNISPTSAACYSIGSTSNAFNVIRLGGGVSAAITPGTGVVYANNTPKAWMYGKAGSSIVCSTVGFNLSQSFITASGCYRLTFLNPMYDSKYCIVAANSTDTGQWLYPIASQTTAYFEIKSWFYIGHYTFTAGIHGWSVVVYGNQFDPVSTA